MAHTQGPILELGCSDFSTPVLHAVCSANKRFILTADSDRQIFDLFTDMTTDWHQFLYVPALEDGHHNPQLWDDVGCNNHWSVVLIDHQADRRVADIKRLRGNTDIFVIHDTEDSLRYGYNQVLGTFKYKFEYTRYFVKTTLVSDTIDVAEFFV